MIVAIADTHTVIWYLFSDSRLGRNASEFVDGAIAGVAQIGISAISLAEMVYLIEKGRIPARALDEVVAAFADRKNVLREVPLNAGIALCMQQVSRQQIPDLPDRIIAATALSRDGRIRDSNIETIW